LNIGESFEREKLRTYECCGITKINKRKREEKVYKRQGQ